MTKQIVTRESLQSMLDDPRPEYVMHVVGRALVALFNRQTESEKQSNDTKEHNTIGFNGADGKGGCLTAKSYLKNKRLQDWQVEKWTRRGNNGYSRLCKYWNQLNEVAVAKQGN